MLGNKIVKKFDKKKLLQEEKVDKKQVTFQNNSPGTSRFRLITGLRVTF